MPSSLARNVILLLLLKFVGLAHADDVREPKIGSPERKTIMEIMRAPVSTRIGKPVIFIGTLKIAGEWATFEGDVKPTDGVMPKGRAADELSLDFFALLRLEKGRWKVVHFGFAGDTSLKSEARQKFPKVPKELVPKF